MSHHRHSQGPTAKPPKEGESLARRHHNFTIELFLDEMGEASEIFIVHDQSGEKGNLASWEPEKLVDFIAGHTGLKAGKSALEEPAVHHRQVSRTATTSAPLERAPVSRHATQPKVSPELVGTPHLRDLKVLSVDSQNPDYLLRSGQPFKVHLTLDLTAVTSSRKVPVIYDASIIARQPGGPDVAAGEAHRKIEASKSTTISVASAGLPPGMYRLDAVVKVALAGAEHERNAGAVAYLQGGDLIEVY